MRCSICDTILVDCEYDICTACMSVIDCTIDNSASVEQLQQIGICTPIVTVENMKYEPLTKLFCRQDFTQGDEV